MFKKLIDLLNVLDDGTGKLELKKIVLPDFDYKLENPYIAQVVSDILPHATDTNMKWWEKRNGVLTVYFEQ